MSDHYYAVIMAGGGGTRLWPLSRKETPKQMLQLVGDRTMFQFAVDRLDGLFPAERILVVTVAEQAVGLQEQCPEIPKENYLLEPMPRGTASVVGLAAIELIRRDPEATMAILTADHYIEDIAMFQKLLLAASDVAQRGNLVTLGIVPTFPATGYGYVQRGQELGEYRGAVAYHALRFKEKPTTAKAKEMLAGGDHYWNSGMFIWRVDRILEEIRGLMPDLAVKLAEISEAWEEDGQNEVLREVWPTIHPETIDYGIMEHAAQVAVLPAARLGWNDVGSWDSLFDVLPADENGNIVVQASHYGLDTESSLIFGSSSERAIVTVGLKDHIVVDTGDVVFICPRNDAQKVRQLVNAFKESDWKRYL
jgi:mannose-1-phosphate guanylyltransferase